jgi:hypothetical protein
MRVWWRLRWPKRRNPTGEALALLDAELAAMRDSHKRQHANLKGRVTALRHDLTKLEPTRDDWISVKLWKDKGYQTVCSDLRKVKAQVKELENRLGCLEGFRGREVKSDS